MADRNLEQTDNTLDRAEQILAEHSSRLDVMTQAITAFTHSVEQAFERFEQQHEEHEAILKAHESRIKMMEEVQRDTREMLRIWSIERLEHNFLNFGVNHFDSCRSPIVPQ